MNGYFNPRRLSFARRRRGLSKVQLADKLFMTSRVLIGYELGQYLPPPDTLSAIAKALEFPESFFSGPDLEQIAAEDVSFRALTKMSARQKEAAMTQAELALYLSRWLEERFELPALDLPDLSQEPDPETAADALREHWKLGNLSIRNMVHLLESKGVRVFSISVHSVEVDALSTWKAGVPLVFLNGAKSSERSRFDAAHELGHLVLHRHGSPIGRLAEEQAQQFASAFLMPKASVVPYAPKLATINELVKMKKIFGVSLAAVNYRLHNLRLTSDWQYRSLSVQISKRGFRTSEPESLMHESSMLLPKVLGRLREEGISRKQIAQSLGVPVAEIENLLFSLLITSLQGGGSTSFAPREAPRLQRVK